MCERVPQTHHHDNFRQGIDTGREIRKGSVALLANIKMTLCEFYSLRQLHTVLMTVYEQPGGAAM